jgi:hypothetical protein
VVGALNPEHHSRHKQHQVEPPGHVVGRRRPLQCRNTSVPSAAPGSTEGQRGMGRHIHHIEGMGGLPMVGLGIVRNSSRCCGRSSEEAGQASWADRHGSRQWAAQLASQRACLPHGGEVQGQTAPAKEHHQHSCGGRTISSRPMVSNKQPPGDGIGGRRYLWITVKTPKHPLLEKGWLAPIDLPLLHLSHG